MLLIADVHGAWPALQRVASLGEPLLILGDLLNLVDYRTMEGLFSEVFGKDMVMEVARLRAAGDHQGARHRWKAESAGREDEILTRLRGLMAASYEAAAEALAGAEAYVTFGNVDDPEMLAGMVPAGCRFVDGEVVEIEGIRVGFAGGGIGPEMGAPGIVTEDEMRAKLAGLDDFDVLCTHAAPAVVQLSHDVVAGSCKHSEAVLEFVQKRQPRHLYFGDIHQPQAIEWRVGRTVCRNVGYFRATGRPVRHG
jgi:Icc-related predicted phosphoesterase